MNILEIEATSFPLYHIEVQLNDVWTRFTDEPFESKEQAELHIQSILDAYSSVADRELKKSKIRVAEYTKEILQQDLIKNILRQNNLIKSALSLLSIEQLKEVLISVGYKEK